jgi:predicted nucleotidyltransferase
MEEKLSELVKRLNEAAGKNLRSVVLYGSAVTGEFVAEHSDLNILCIIETTGSGELEQLHPAVSWWMGEGNPVPLIFTLEEFERSAALFAMEVLDIKNRHRVLFGSNWWSDWLDKIKVPLQLHRILIERELRFECLKLRQTIMAAPPKAEARLKTMLGSVSVFCALFRHGLAEIGHEAPQTKRESVAAVAAWTGADPSAFNAILDYREGKRKRRHIDLEAALHAYLEFVEVVTNAFDRRFAEAP